MHEGEGGTGLGASGISLAVRTVSASSLGAGLLHAWRWGLFYSGIVFPFDSPGVGMASVLICWNAVLAACYAAVALLARLTRLDFSKKGALIPASLLGTAGTLLLALEPGSGAALSSPTWAGLLMCGISMSGLIVAWSESFSSMEADQVKVSASLFIAFGTIVFLICSLLPRDVARVAVALCPAVSCAVLKTRENVRIVPSAGPVPERKAGPLLAFTQCLLSLSAANSLMRGLGLTVVTVDGNARLLFSAIVAMCIALLFVGSQKTLFVISFLAVATGLELLSADCGELGSTVLGLGFVCFEILLWIVVAETAKKRKVRAAGVAAVVWLGLHVGSIVGIAAGIQFPMSGGGIPQPGRTASLVLLFCALCAFALCFGKSFLDMFDPAQDSDQPSASLASNIHAFAERYALSPRETEICAVLARGMSVKYIASTMVLSENTVKTHVRSIYRKAGVNTRDQLIERIAQS